MHAELLIDGYFFGGPCDQSIGKTQHYAPYDGELVGTAAEAGWSELDAALNAARNAFQAWRQSPFTDRQALLGRVSTMIRERSEELANLMAREIGKPVSAAHAEIERCAITFKLAADYLGLVQQEHYPLDYDGRGKDFVGSSERFPVGVVMAIVPYNWPLNLAAHKVAPSLAAGNTVVVKAPSLGTLTTLTLGRILHECGCPPGVVNFLNCSATLAQKAVEDPRTDMLSFTGSPAVGWKLKGLIPKKRVALELGGDATAVVAADADITSAIEKLVKSSFLYAGQICISTQHILVDKTIYEEFTKKFVAAAEACPAGNPLDPQTVCGPVSSAESADRIMEWIQEAEDEGAQVLTGGNRTGLIIEPTVVANVPDNVKLGCEEVFGPVVTLASYSTLEEAIERINRSKFGLQVAIFTNSVEAQAQFYRQCDVGSVIVNDSPSVRFDSMPYGGNKESGYGREGIASAFHEMTSAKSLVERKQK
ncbi:aldehyde dehydrogenase family protein [Kamptonema cortianum]|nr:aldehyde dehydrogenase family protein [Geitlerinema splendidum]MDK3156170.1 aldehyde dehydrogenase family protein [Kamptonema cortianum]